MTDHIYRSGCPINLGLEVFGDKWTLLIVRDMMFAGKRHYREFLASDEGISSNILATGWNGFAAVADPLRNDPAWTVHELPCGHDIPLLMPEELAGLLEQA